jgi:hypothetical protein
VALPIDDHGAAPSAPPDTLVQRVLRWLRAGYPDGVPQQDYVALLGILRRDLTPGEVDRVVEELSDQAEAGTAVMTPQLVHQRITDVVKGPVREEDVVRVSARLAAAGWPLGSPVAGDPEGSEAAGGFDEVRSGLLARVVEWLRAGYPSGLPERDFVPLVALLRRRLSDEEVQVVARRLVEAGILPSGRVDIGAEVARVTTELPAERDVQRVRGYLAERGWPVDD